MKLFKQSVLVLLHNASVMATTQTTESDSDLYKRWKWYLTNHIYNRSSDRVQKCMRHEETPGFKEMIKETKALGDSARDTFREKLKDWYAPSNLGNPEATQRALSEFNGNWKRLVGMASLTLFDKLCSLARFIT